MTGVELLIGMIQEANRAQLEEVDLILTTKNIRFTDLYPGEWDGGFNTKVGATGFGPRLEGTHVYYYNRLDIQQAFVDIGVTEVVAQVIGEVTPASILAALKEKHNLWLRLDDLSDYSYSNDVAVFTIKPTSYVWLGTLTVTVVAEALTLGAMFPFNVLNGLVEPGGEEITDGGVYEELIGQA
jgi:hypothetical protein